MPSLDQIVGASGYPDRSAILIVGPPGVSKEAFSYSFIQSGLEQDDLCIYVTRFNVSEVVQDQKAFGVKDSERKPIWLASGGGGEKKFDLNDLNGLFDNISRILKENIEGRRVRIVIDALSSLLILNTSDTTYKFLQTLIGEMKGNCNGVILATLDEGMHIPQVIAAMEQLFDGFIELSIFKVGLRVLPLLRIGKMRGFAPPPGYFRFSITSKGAFISTSELELDSLNRSIVSSISPESAMLKNFESQESSLAFEYLVKSFIDDYVKSRLSVDQSGWRTRGDIIEVANLHQMSLYGRGGKYGPVLKELISKGLVETRFFPGHRGRGGEVVKIRVAYEKDLVREHVQKTSEN